MNDNIERLKKLETEKLIDVVRNYRQYGFEEEFRTEALSILEKRGISQNYLKATGTLENINYDIAEDLFNSFRKSSRRAFILFGLLILSNLLLPIILAYSESIGVVFLVLSGLALLFYFVYLIKSFINQNQFYKLTGQNYGTEGLMVYLFLGMPLYIVMYFYFRNQMNHKMNEIK